MLLESRLIYLGFAIATTELESELQGSVLIKQDYYLYRPWSKAEDYNFRYKQHEQTNCSKAEFLLVIAFSNSKKGEENYMTYLPRCLQAECLSPALPAKVV